MRRHGQSACVDCGETYQLKSSYKGNYCPDCHAEWASEESSGARPSPRPMRSRVTPSVRRIDEDDDGVPSRYDSE